MFTGIFMKNVLRLSHRVLIYSTKFSIVNRNVAVNNNSFHYVLPSSYSPCRLYTQPAKLENMVVDFQDVKKAISNEKVLIVDVREPDEVKEYGKIPGSVNIPLGKVSTALNTMSDIEFENTYNRPKPSEDTEIIFYCMIGKRSGMAQQNAFNLGYKNVKNYLGSWTDWASKNE